MQINATVGVLYAQMNYASRAASDAATGPESSLAMSRLLAQEMAKQEQSQVQAPDPSAESKITDENVSEREARKQFTDQEHENDRQDVEDSPTTPSDPLVGNLINMKI